MARVAPWLRWLLPIPGFLALIWFLVRVVPKPSRAAYPCQKVAAPMASGFLLWLLAVPGAALAFKKARNFLYKSRYLLALLFAFLGLFALSMVLVNAPFLFASGWIPPDPPNTPVGTARGIHPGRVVWVHDPSATSWSGDMAGSNYWWTDANTDQVKVDDMMSKTIRWLAGETSDEAAWDALFRHFNQNRGKGDIGYVAGEKIAVKLNLNNSGNHGSWEVQHVPSPHAVYALIWQLVNRGGVTNQADIALGDPSRAVGQPLVDKCTNDFPDIVWVDRLGGDGRTKAQHDTNVVINFANTNVYYHKARYVAKCFTEADYIINFGLLRGHNFAGVTLTAKNHFGSTWVNATNEWHEGWTPGATNTMNGMHGYINAHAVNWGGNWVFDERPLGSYNALVDLMGHKDLGEKTLLFLVDGLYAALHQSETSLLKWTSSPFNDDWPSSFFASQDGVAIESVGIDFLRSDPAYDSIVYGTVDDYLHEAAQANSPPSGSFYDPEGDGTNVASLGVHEHWNNSTNKQYSRNLGTGTGIELVRNAGEAYAHLAAVFVSGTFTNEYFGFAVGVDIGETYVIQTASNLLEQDPWVPVATCTPASSPYLFSDPASTNYTSLFYRMKLVVP